MEHSPSYIVRLGLYGVTVRRNFGCKNDVPENGRGCVRGMSKQSRARLVKFLSSNTVPGLPTWAMSLTIRHPASPDVWRKRLESWKHYRRIMHVPWVWRVELQRRGAPHLHLIVWGTDSDCQAIRDAWLSVWGMRDDASLQYAVHYRQMESGGWYTYLTCHHIKSGQDPHGWAGRSWGVHARAQFLDVDVGLVRLTPDEYSRFRRILNRILRSRGAKRDLPSWSSYTRLGPDPGLVRAICRRVKKRTQNFEQHGRTSF